MNSDPKKFKAPLSEKKKSGRRTIRQGKNIGCPVLLDISNLLVYTLFIHQGEKYACHDPEMGKQLGLAHTQGLQQGIGY
jgi:hypothetical protein